MNIYQLLGEIDDIINADGYFKDTELLRQFLEQCPPSNENDRHMVSNLTK